MAEGSWRRGRARGADSVSAGRGASGDLRATSEAVAQDLPHDQEGQGWSAESGQSHLSGRHHQHTLHGL